MLHLSKSNQKKIVLAQQHKVDLKVQQGMSLLSATCLGFMMVSSCVGAFFVAPQQAAFFAYFLAYVCGASFVWHLYTGRDYFVSTPPYYSSSYTQLIAIILVTLSVLLYLVGNASITVMQFNSAIMLLALLVPLPFGFWLFLYKKRVQQLVTQTGLMRATPTFIEQAQQAQWLIIADDYLACQPYEIAWFDENDTLVNPEFSQDINASIFSYFSSDKTARERCVIDAHELSFFNEHVVVLTPSAAIYKAYRIAVCDMGEENRRAFQRGIKLILCTKLPFKIAFYQAQRLDLVKKTRELLSSESLNHIELDEVEQTYEICSSMRVLFDCGHHSIKRLVEVLSTCAQSIILMTNYTYENVPTAVEQINWIGFGSISESSLKAAMIAPRIDILFKALDVVQRATADSRALLRTYRTITSTLLCFIGYVLCTHVDSFIYISCTALICYAMYIVPYLSLHLYAQRVIYHSRAGFADWVKPLWILSFLYVISLITLPTGFSIISVFCVWYGMWASSHVIIEQQYSM